MLDHNENSSRYSLIGVRSMVRTTDFDSVNGSSNLSPRTTMLAYVDGVLFIDYFKNHYYGKNVFVAINKGGKRIYYKLEWSFMGEKHRIRCVEECTETPVVLKYNPLRVNTRESYSVCDTAL